jgi:hypothetical protein
MKTFKFTVLLLHFISSSFAQQDVEANIARPAIEKPSHEIEYAHWFNQLNQYLLTSDDNYQKAMGIASTLNATLNMPENNNQEAIELLPPQVNVLNELIAKTDLSSETLDLLVNWCFKLQIKSLCDQKTLLDKHLQQQPENLNVYFQPIQIAIEQNDPNLIKQTLKLMAQSKHSHLTYYIVPEFSQVLDNYIDKNPLPSSYVQAMINKQEFLNELDVSDNKEQQRLTKEFLKTAIKMSYAMLYSLPQVQSLYEFCKTRQEFLEECVTITQILINHSDSLNARGLGYAMLMGIHETRGQQKFFDIVAAKQEKYRLTLHCLSKATQSSHPVKEIFDPKFQAIQLKAINEFDKIHELATYVYKKYKDENPDQTNPESCFPENDSNPNGL